MKDPILKQRLEAATDRKDRWFASEVKQGDKRRHEDAKPSDPPVEAEPPNLDEDGIPEVNEEDGEDVDRETKRARVASTGEDVAEEEPTVIGFTDRKLRRTRMITKMKMSPLLSVRDLRL